MKFATRKKLIIFILSLIIIIGIIYFGIINLRNNTPAYRINYIGYSFRYENKNNKIDVFIDPKFELVTLNTLSEIKSKSKIIQFITVDDSTFYNLSSSFLGLSKSQKTIYDQINNTPMFTFIASDKNIDKQVKDKMLKSKVYYYDFNYNIFDTLSISTKPIVNDFRKVIN